MSQPKKNRCFASDVFKLASGTAIAQVLSIIASPILTRLYGPDTFGLSTLFISITAVIGVVACMRYEFSIMLPKKDEEAANLLSLSIFFAVVVSVLTIPAFWFGGPIILRWLNAPGLGPYLWLVAPMVFISGVFTALNYWNSRTRRFGRLSLANVGNSVAATAIKLGAGFAGYTTAGSLIFGGFVGAAAASLVLGLQIWRDDRRMLLKSMSWHDMTAGLRRYSRFPIFDTWSALLGTVAWQLPVFLLSSFFSKTVVGYYGLGMIVLQLPMSLIGSSVAQVFFQKAAEAKFDGSLAFTVENTVTRLGMLVMFPLLLLALIGKELFTVVFGANWAEAGVYAQILAIWIFFVFLGSPISTLFSILEKQKTSLVINILTIMARAGALIIGGVMGDPRVAIALFSIVGVITYAGSSFWLLRQADASISKVLANLAKYLVYSVPMLFVVAFAKEFMLLSPLAIVAVGGLASVPYYLIIIRRDDALRGSIGYMIRSISSRK
jgi:O-antigen/teichoic acid export membrane protein